MKKIGILTLYYKNDNYGGIAQAYALQKYIEYLGYNSELISYKRTTPPMLNGYRFSNNPMQYINRKLYKFPIKIKQRIENKFANYKYGESLQTNIEMRKNAFQRSRLLIPHTSRVYTDETIKETINEFDCFISGSDQIWKPGVIRPAFVCDFLPCNITRFSYASSIAVKHLSVEYGHFMKKALSQYMWISVREVEAQDYLQKLLNRKVDVVVDPTLLLPFEAWDAVTSDKVIEEKYIFVYLLGQDVEQRRDIQAYAHNLNLKIVFLPHVEGKIRACDVGYGDIHLYDVDLPCFFSLIKNAEIIFTDSFHAAVFSIIFNKRFWIYDRIVLQLNSGMDSRLDTLLRISGLLERKITCNKHISDINTEINYDSVNKQLIPIIHNSQALLEKALVASD